MKIIFIFSHEKIISIRIGTLPVRVTSKYSNRYSTVLVRIYVAENKHISNIFFYLLVHTSKLSPMCVA